MSVFNAANIIKETEKNYLVSFVLKFSFKIFLETTSYTISCPEILGPIST